MHINTYFNLSFVIIHSIFRKYKKFNLFLLSVGLGFIYDLIFTNTIFLNTFLYSFIFFLTGKMKKLNIYSIYLINILTFIVFNYLLLMIYGDVNINILFIIKTVLFNFIIFVLVYKVYRRIYINR